MSWSRFNDNQNNGSQQIENPPAYKMSRQLENVPITLLSLFKKIFFPFSPI